MKVLRVVTQCTATIQEDWLIRVSDRMAKRLLADPDEALSVLGEEGTLSVTVTVLGD